MRLGPLRYVLCALVAALVVFTSGGAAASGTSAACTEADLGVPDTAADGGLSPETPLVSLPEQAAPPVFIPSDDACDPAYQVEAGPAMCTTDGASAVAPRVIHDGSTATLDAPEPCSSELALGATYDRDDSPHERPPSVALEACLFISPSLPPPPMVDTAPSFRPRQSTGRRVARRLDRPPRG